MGRLRHKKRSTPIASINMTPMVDLVLVLLVIFMVAAPLATSMIQVQLPKTSQTANETPPTDNIFISIDGKGQIFWDDIPITKAQLSRKLTDVKKEKKDQRVFLRADKSLAYQHVISMIDSIKASGMHNVSLVTLIQNGTEKQYGKRGQLH